MTYTHIIMYSVWYGVEGKREREAAGRVGEDLER